MKMVYMSEDEEIMDFAKRAAERFTRDDAINTFTDLDIKAGCLFALRFGLGGDCVVVFRLDEDFEPVNYKQLIRQYEV